MAVAVSISRGRAHNAMCGEEDTLSVQQSPVNEFVTELREDFGG